MPVSLDTPITLPTEYSDAATLGPFQTLDKIVFTLTGGVASFQVGTVDKSGAVNWNQAEAEYPAGTWGFENIYGIRFRSRDAGNLATLDPCAGYFDDDPDPYAPGVIPGTATLTSTLNIQHNDALIATEPTLDFVDGTNITYAVTSDVPGNRVKVTPSITGVITSVFGRFGPAITAQAGDYTAAQVTNAADKSSAAQQAFTAEVKAPDYNVTGLTGATAASRYAGATTTGHPVSGTFAKGDYVITQDGHIFVCTAAGTPGTWSDVGSKGNVVTSVFGRTGAVVATAGDYTAAQVTNAADLTKTSEQIFAGNISAQNLGYGVTLQAGGQIYIWDSSTTEVNPQTIIGPLNLQFDDPVSGNTILLTPDPANNGLSINASAFPIHVTVAGGLLCTESLPLGYGQGAGFSVTQLTSKSTTVTCNVITGQITMNNAALAAGARVSFNVLCSAYGPNCVVMANIIGGISSANNYRLEIPFANGATNAFVIALTNITSGSLSEAVVIQYNIIQGSPN